MIFDQASALGGPVKGALHHPPAGHQHEAALGFRGLDHLQRDAMSARGGSGLWP